MSLQDHCEKHDIEFTRFDLELELKIGSYKFTCIEDMPDSDKAELIGYLMPALDDPLEFIIESRDSDAVLRVWGEYLRDRPKRKSKKFLSELEELAINYYKELLNEYIDNKLFEFEKGDREFIETPSFIDEGHVYYYP